MLKRYYWIFFAIVLSYTAILSALCQEEPANVHDHAMTHFVSNGRPADRTASFSTNDDVAISWIEIGDDLRYSHRVSWNWYSPDGKFFNTDTETTGKPETGYYYEWLSTGALLIIRGYDPANMPGLWKVEVHVDGDYWLTDWFSINL
jgi:hypothetical protein